MVPRKLISLCFVALALLCSFGSPGVLPVQADEGSRLWNAAPVTTAFGPQRHVRVASDGAGGAIFVWQDRREVLTSDLWDVYAQRLGADGEPLWADQGVAVAASGSAVERSPEIAPDGAGGAIVVWVQETIDVPPEVTGIYAQRLDPTGTPLWGPGGVRIASAGRDPLAVAPDGSGGAYVAFPTATGVRCARVFADGSLAAPGVDGIDLGGGTVAGGGPAIVADGQGAAIVAMADGWCVRAQKVEYGPVAFVGNTLFPSWGAAPVEVSCDPRREARPALAADGAGGAFLTWARQREAGDPLGNHVVVQHLDASGEALWAPGGVVVVDSDVHGGTDFAWSTFELAPAVAADGLGGAVVAWNDWRNDLGEGGNDDIYAQRVDASGTPVWADGGISVWYHPDGSQRRPQVVPTGAGGSLVVFQDESLGSWDIVAVKLDAAGQRWPEGRSYVFYDGVPSTAAQTDPQVVFDGTGPSPTGAVIAWVDWGEGGAQFPDLFAEKLELALTPSPKPDLVVDAVVFDPPHPEPFEGFTVQIRARNRGEAATGGGFHMGLDGLGSGLFFDTCSFPMSLGPGGVGACYIRYADGKPEGTYPVSACVDCSPLVHLNDLVEESDESNNQAEATLVVAPADTRPPEPDPMTWAVAPHGVGTTAASMTATEATDPSGPVEYFFECLTPGCADSGWQADAEYTDTGLAPNTLYGWRVRARDRLGNATDWSLPGYDYTDIEPPEGVAFDLDDVGSTYLKAKVSNLLSHLDQGQSGVILFNFTAGTDSGWKQDNDWWRSDGLTPNTRYAFAAQARNGSGRETPQTDAHFLWTRAARPGAPHPSLLPGGVWVTWDARGNPPGTEYLCENTTTGRSSGWTTSTGWTDSEAECGTTYAYRVRARNAQLVETEWSEPGTIDTSPCPGRCDADTDGDGDVDGRDLHTVARHLGQVCLVWPFVCPGDVDGDRDVDDRDVRRLASAFGRRGCAEGGDR
ncbi:MAG: hypothetical protein Kow0092_20960 [Deferrisomatales bacterium]